MRVLFASSEVFPLIKTGGLADVSGALPAALAAAGTDIRLLMPGYPVAMDGVTGKRRVADLGDSLGVGSPASLVSGKMPGTNLPVWLIDCPALYDRPGGPYQDASGADHADNHMRFGLLSRVAAQLSCEDSPLKWRAQVLHANDWQTGLAAAYLHHWGPRERAGTVFSIHNIAYQGLFPKKVVAPLGFDWSLFGMDGFEFWDQLSFLKSGLVFSDKIATVSRRYAAAILISPLLLLSKSRKHFITLGFVDADDRQQALVVRVDKGDIRPALAALAARTGRRVEYQDAEARKAGQD